jgi:hypothetical protein
MTSKISRMSTVALAAFAAVLASMAMARSADAQEPAAQAATGPAPALRRTADGHPDFSGVWTARLPGGGLRAINDARGICVINCTGPDVNPGATPGATGGPNAPAAPAAAAGGPAAAARPPARPAPNFPNYRPELRERVALLNRNQVQEDPALRCVNPGLPRIGPPDKIIQTATEVVFLYDDLNGAFWRVVPIDGRGHREDAEQNYLGDSVGRWDGEKLLIETNSFNDVTWLTDNGAFHTADMRIVEELSAEGGNISYRLTVHDPAVLAEPWVKSARLNPARANPLEPVPCIEQSIGQMVGNESYHPNARW